MGIELWMQLPWNGLYCNIDENVFAKWFSKLLYGV